ncbi:MAG: glycosyl transferase [Omnitrophica bacterium GWA2_52_8]|nr:MAG: glycosyl transferase [Omnitrophica bacterium GWA2_52_8]
MIQVSVIIPAWNRAGLLPRALESVLNQQGVSFEVLVVDDGSDDGTPEILHKDFPQVRLLSRKRKGPAAARNSGIEHSAGEWIAFLDSDDTWLPGKLAAQTAFLEAHPDIPVCQTEEIWIRNGRRVNPMKKHRKYGGWIFEHCLPLCIISPSAVMMHRSVFDEAGPFDESYPACEDYELWLRIAARYPVGLIEKPYTVKYGGHAGQRSHEFPAMDRFRIRALVKILASGVLNELQSTAARRELEKKARIFIHGAKKRGLWKEAEDFSELVRKAGVPVTDSPVTEPAHS